MYLDVENIVFKNGIATKRYDYISQGEYMDGFIYAHGRGEENDRLINLDIIASIELSEEPYNDK